MDLIDNTFKEQIEAVIDFKNKKFKENKNVKKIELTTSEYEIPISTDA
jgi:hypothetical protein